MRIALITLILLTILHGLYLYLVWSTIGFPDGHKTEVDLMNQSLYLVYMVIDGLFALFFLIQWLSLNHVTRQNRIKWIFVMYLVFLGITILIDQILTFYFDHGQGG